MAYNHKLPVNASVEGQICVPLFLPADKDYIALFLGQIRKLANDRHYERDENKTALIVRRKWLDVTINPLIEALINGEDCGMNEIDCGAIEACLQDSETIAEIDARIAELESNMATKEEICEAIQCALEDAAKRYLMAQSSNLNFGIEILPDDGKSLSLIDGGKPFVADPVDASELEIRNGKCYNVGAGFAGFISTLNTFILEGFTAVQIAELMAYSYIMLYTQLDAQFVQIIQDYMDFADDEVIPAVNAEDISKFIWNFGLGKPAMLKWAIAVQNSMGTDAFDIGYSYRQLILSIADQQFTAWYNEGATKPRNTYQTYPDYIVPISDAFTVSPSDLFTGTTLKRFWACFDDYALAKPADNRWAIVAEGVIVNNVLNRKFTAFHYQGTNGAWQSQTTKILYSSVGAGYTPEAIPPINETGKMTAYYAQSSANKILGFAWESLPSSWVAADCSGEITLKRVDLGIPDALNWLGWVS